MASSTSGQNKTVPKDALVIMSILKDMGITEYDPQVVTQLMEFTYRYVTTTLEDAKIYAQHAGRKVMDSEDVQLAVQMQLDKNFTTPPPRDLLMEVARGKNMTPLPQIKPHCGIRLPPDRYCMTACNFELKTSRKPIIQKHTIFQSNNSQPKQTKRTVQAMQRSHAATAAAVPKPVIKFTAAGSTSNVAESSQWKPMNAVAVNAMEVDEPPASYIKRKHPDDD